MKKMKKESLSFRPIVDKRVAGFIKETGDFSINSFSTPFHVLFPKIFLDNINGFRKIYRDNKIEGKIYFACKSNKSNAFIGEARKGDAGVEVSSIYELKKALSMGYSSKEIIISGPMKSPDFLFLGLKCGAIISIDDVSELESITKIFNKSSFKLCPNIIVRINNNSGMISKFGIPVNKLKNIFKIIKKNGFNFSGFSFHINNYSIIERAELIVVLVNELINARNYGFDANIIDIGGGFTVSYIKRDDWMNLLGTINTKRISSLFLNNKQISEFYPYFNDESGPLFLNKILNYEVNQTTVGNLIRKNNIELIIEPGRSLLDQCGITVFKILGIKKIEGENFIFVDGNINHLSEQWFNSDYLVDPILVKSGNQKRTKRKVIGFVSGNLCLEQDMLTWRRICLNNPAKGDLLIFINTAGYQMDSNESEFHDIVLPEKYCALNNNKKWNIYNDADYKCLSLKYDL